MSSDGKIRIKVELEIDGLEGVAGAIIDLLKARLIDALSDPTSKIGQLGAMLGLFTQK